MKIVPHIEKLFKLFTRNPLYITIIKIFKHKYNLKKSKNFISIFFYFFFFFVDKHVIMNYFRRLLWYLNSINFFQVLCSTEVLEDNFLVLVFVLGLVAFDTYFHIPSHVLIIPIKIDSFEWGLGFWDATQWLLWAQLFQQNCYVKIILPSQFYIIIFWSLLFIVTCCFIYQTNPTENTVLRFFKFIYDCIWIFKLMLYTGVSFKQVK